MANTLGTTNGLVIAQRALATLLRDFPVLSDITTDFSALSARYNQTVSTSIVSASTASQFNPVVGYTSTDRTQVDVQVQLNRWAHHTYSVTDAERTTSQVDLISRFADTAAHALGQAVMDDLFALFTPANFTNQKIVSYDSFSRKSVIDIATTMNNLFIPKLGRFMIVDANMYGSLSNDLTVVQNFSNAGANTIQTGKLTGIHGFNDIVDYTAIGGSANTPNTPQPNLVGIAGVKESVLFCTRLPDAPTTVIPGVISTVTEPHSGLSVQLREWYDMTLAKESRTMTLMYGFAKGNAATLVRMLKK